MNKLNPSGRCYKIIVKLGQFLLFVMAQCLDSYLHQTGEFSNF